MAQKPVQFTLNGDQKAAFTVDGENLLDFLRRRVGDMTPKYGCGQGTCGACTVIIDGEPHMSCVTLAETVEGRDVQTLAGIGNGSGPSALQNAFMRNFAAQCGYCTPGMLMAAKALLDKNPNPNREEVVEALAGNICRCTGYEAIINSVLEAASGTTRSYG